MVIFIFFKKSISKIRISAQVDFNFPELLSNIITLIVIHKHTPFNNISKIRICAQVEF